MEPLDEMLRRGRALIELDRPKEAIALFAQAVAAEPQNAEALTRLSQAHYAEGDFRRALEVAGRAIAVDPESEWAHRIQAHSFIRLRKLRKAIQPAEAAARLAPQEPLALYTLGYVLLRCKKPGRAKEVAEQLLALHPDSTYAHELLCDFAIQARKWKDAEAHAREQLRLDPESGNAMNNLGVALLNQRRKREAVDVLHQAAKLMPRQQFVRTNLYQAVNAYRYGWLGIGVLLILARVLMGSAQASGMSDQGVIIFLSSIAAMIAFVVYRQRSRFKQLSPSLQEFSRLEDRKVSRRIVQRSVVVIGAIGALLLLGAALGDRPIQVGVWIFVGVMALYCAAAGAWAFRRG